MSKRLTLLHYRKGGANHLSYYLISNIRHVFRRVPVVLDTLPEICGDELLTKKDESC